jgi:hypothetical protein
MVKKSNKKTTRSKQVDSVYFLKLVVYLLLGSLWVRIVTNTGVQVPVPIGLMLGLLLLRHERLQIDKKIEYALLLLAAFISFWLPLGLHITI